MTVIQTSEEERLVIDRIGIVDRVYTAVRVERLTTHGWLVHEDEGITIADEHLDRVIEVLVELAAERTSPDQSGDSGG